MPTQQQMAEWIALMLYPIGSNNGRSGQLRDAFVAGYITNKWKTIIPNVPASLPENGAKILIQNSKGTITSGFYAAKW